MKPLKIIHLLLFVALVTMASVDIYTERYWHFSILVVAIYLNIGHLWIIHRDEGKIKFGATRVVYLIGPFAFKFPVIVEWRLFLMGLVGNMQETNFSRNMNLQNKLCPIYFAMWGGFLNIMPRCTPLREEELPEWWNFEEWTMADIIDTDKYHIIVSGLPVEDKLSSFGRLPNGSIVAVDYGSWDRVTVKTK